MPAYFERTRAALRHLLGRRRAETAAGDAVPVPIGGDLVLVGDRVAFGNPDRAAGDPVAWLGLLEAALERNAPLADTALAVLHAQAGRLPAVAFLGGAAGCSRLIRLLSPRAGLSARLQELRTSGVLGVIFPECYGDGAETHSLAAIGNLERLLGETDLAGSRFGTMLHELPSPELVVLAALLHQPPGSKDHDPAKASVLAKPALDRLQVEGDDRHAVLFLIENQQQMAQVAFRKDTGDPEVVARFAAAMTSAAQLNALGTEDHLKMLCLLTVADLGAAGREPLTSWKAELLWRLFVDTYNYLTMAYGDDVIDRDAAVRTALHQKRPADVTEAELVHFLEGLPQRYLTLFDADSIYQHVRLWRNIGPDDVHSFLSRKGEAWELTVVTLDKPYLFSNICGALASVGADILRGQALTSRNGLVLDVFEFSDGARAVIPEDLERLLADVVAGRVDISAQLAARHPAPGHPARAPLLYFDNEASHRYTVLELVTSDAPGLLHRISRALSDFGCEVDFVLISTEGDKAIDVFHMRKGGAKLTESDQLALTDALERALGTSA